MELSDYTSTWLGTWSNKEYNYFVDIKSDKITNIEKKNINLDSEKYNFQIDTEYTQDKGVNFNLDLNVIYNETKLSEITEKTKKTETKSRIITMKTKATSVDEKSIKEVMNKNEHSEVNMTKDTILGSIEEFIKTKNSKDKKIYDASTILGINQGIDENKLRKILDIPSRTKEEKTRDETIFLHTKQINLNLDTYLGYNFKPTIKMKFSLGMKYNLNANYETLNKVILEDTKLFGSRHILFKNKISPEVKMTYNLVHNLNTKLGVDLPVSFENVSFKGVKLNIRMGIEYRW